MILPISLKIVCLYLVASFRILIIFTEKYREYSRNFKITKKKVFYLISFGILIYFLILLKKDYLIQFNYRGLNQIFME